MSEPRTEPVLDVADASTYDTCIFVIRRCLECFALLLSEDSDDHIAWHRRVAGAVS